MKTFYDVVFTGIELLMPGKKINVSTTNVPRLNKILKLLIQKKQQAFVNYGIQQAIFKQYRNLVNREQKSCGARYCKSNVDNFNEKNPKK